MSDGIVPELGVIVFAGIGFKFVDGVGAGDSGDGAGLLVCSNVFCVAAESPVTAGELEPYVVGWLVVETPHDEQPDVGAVS
jgi:hypothetical protein